MTRCLEAARVLPGWDVACGCGRLYKQQCSFAPSWSPDGSEILCGPITRNTLLAIPAGGSEPAPLGNDLEALAVWSADMPDPAANAMGAALEADHQVKLWNRGTKPPIMIYLQNSITRSFNARLFASFLAERPDADRRRGLEL